MPPAHLLSALRAVELAGRFLDTPAMRTASFTLEVPRRFSQAHFQPTTIRHHSRHTSFAAKYAVIIPARP